MELPPQFFEESFDPVEHLLLNLPGLQEELLEREQQTTRSVLGAINSRLSARVMRSYGAFVHGMAQVQQLESDLIITAILCRSAPVTCRACRAGWSKAACTSCADCGGCVG